MLRGVLVPLFFAFLLAYALDPFVDWLEARKVPRTLAAPIVMLGDRGALRAHPDLRDPDVRRRAARGGGRAADRSSKRLEARVEPWLWQNFHVKPPHTMSELGTRRFATSCRQQFPNL